MAYEPEPRQWEQKDWLYEKYWGEMKSVREIADECEVEKRTLSKQFDRLGIPRRPRGYGSGTSFSPFAGFYNSDESARTDDESLNQGGPEEDYSIEPEWAKIAEEDSAIGDSATFS